jgi:hypothetical protein
MHLDFEAGMIFCICLLSILKVNDTYKKHISGPTRLGSIVPVNSQFQQYLAHIVRNTSASHESGSSGSSFK